MENIEQKADFLRSDYTKQLATLTIDTPRRWGKMNAQQMVEHMTDYIRIASGKTLLNVVTPVENLPRMQAFLDSEKPFKENTPNQLMPAEPAAMRHGSIAEAIVELQDEIHYFFDVYEKEAGKFTPNPFFGNLDFNRQVQLLHKHATHHLRQFGIPE